MKIGLQNDIFLQVFMKFRNKCALVLYSGFEDLFCRICVKSQLETEQQHSYWVYNLYCQLFSPTHTVLKFFT